MKMGLQYPQYMKLARIQETLIYADRYMKFMATLYDPEVLRSQPNWKRLEAFSKSFRAFLPIEVLR